MHVKNVHHIDRVVRDLDRAIATYQRLFNVGLQDRGTLEDRGVELVRFQLGDIWIVLVQPTRADSPVQRFLDERGEGFYHIAYEVEDVEEVAANLIAKGTKLINTRPRRGLEGWRLVDLEIDETFGVMTQLMQPT